MGSHAVQEDGRSPRSSRSLRSKRRVKLAAAGTGVTVLAVGAGFVAATGANAAAPVVSFAETSSWDGGYIGQYTITNSTSSALSTWKVGFALPAGSSVTSLWNGTEAASGDSYTVTPASWNSNVPAGASISFGFEVSGSGQPSGCTINGAACIGGSTPSSGKPTVPGSPTPSKPAPPSPSASQTPAPPSVASQIPRRRPARSGSSLPTPTCPFTRCTTCRPARPPKAPSSSTWRSSPPTALATRNGAALPH